MPSLRLRCVSGAAFYAAKASLIWPQKGETQQLLLLIVCMSTCISLPCGGYCNRVAAAGGFSPLFCQLSCFCGPSVILVSFIPYKSHTGLFFVYVYDGMRLSLWQCQDPTYLQQNDRVKSSPLSEYLVTGHWLGIFVPFGLTRIPGTGTGTSTKLSGTQKANSEWIFKPSQATAVIVGANFLSFNPAGGTQPSLFGCPISLFFS